LIAFGSIQLLKGKSAGKEIVLQDKKLDNKDTVPPAASQENNVAADEKKDDDALEESKQTFAKLDIPVRKNFKNAAKYNFIQQALSTGETNNETDYTETNLVKAQMNNLAARYIAVMTPDCNVVRVSKN
jgi:hypothetical protein